MRQQTPSQPHTVETTTTVQAERMGAEPVRPGPIRTEPVRLEPIPAAPVAAGPAGTTGSAGRRMRRAAIVAGAALAGAVAHAVITSAGGQDLVVTGNGDPMTVTTAASALAGFLAGLLGWAFLAVLERTVKRPARTWTITAAVALVLSFVGPATAGAAPAVLLGLLTLHLVVGAELIALLPRTARAGRIEAAQR